MEYGAIDLHKKESQIRIVTQEGEVIDRRIATTREAFQTMFWGRAPMRVLLEASTESEWVAQHLEAMGHEVIVADPNYAPMYGQRTRRMKTDRRDVAALTEACLRGTYRVVHRRSAAQRAVQQQLQIRRALVQNRTSAIAMVRAMTRAVGLRIRTGGPETFLTRLGALELSPALTDTLAPLRTTIATLNEEVATIDEAVGARVATDPVAKRLMTFPSVGAITASTYIAALDDVHRFRRAGEVTSYLGLVPHEYSSGEHQHRGHVVRSAQPEAQSLLVQTAWRVWLSRDPGTAGLRGWAQRLAQRRGKRVAVVALARRIARILFAMWRDERDFDRTRLRTRAHPAPTVGQSAESLAAEV
jgi:transposase